MLKFSHNWLAIFFKDFGDKKEDSMLVVISNETWV